MTAPATAILLITGARDWTGDPKLIRAALVDFAVRRRGRKCVLFHGDCPHGRVGRSVDMLADGYARELGWRVERFRADWERWGSAAGPIRNRAMVARAVEFLAEGSVVEVMGWPMPHSRGTLDCLKAARNRGLDVTVHEWSEPDA